MSTARALRELNYVKPTAVYTVASLPSEKTCAAVINQTVDGMKDDDIAQVAYRYLQSRAAANTSFYTGAAYFGGMLSSLCAAIFYDVRAVALAFVEALATQAPAQNYFSYADTRDACEAWLKEKMSPAQFAKLHSLEFNQVGLDCLAALMDEMHVDTAFIKQQANKPDGVADLWRLKEDETSLQNAYRNSP